MLPAQTELKNEPFFLYIVQELKFLKPKTHRREIFRAEISKSTRPWTYCNDQTKVNEFDQLVPRKLDSKKWNAKGCHGNVKTKTFWFFLLREDNKDAKVHCARLVKIFNFLTTKLTPFLCNAREYEATTGDIGQKTTMRWQRSCKLAIVTSHRTQMREILVSSQK